MIFLLGVAFILNIFSEPIVAEKERAIVEKNYESQVVAALEGILPKNKFRVSVGVELTPSEEKIEKYRQEEAEGVLPGLTITEPLEEETNNNLVSMVTKIAVTVILDDSVEDTKKPLIESIIKSKIKLIESRGDIITIEKVKIPVVEVKKPDLFETFTNKTFIIIASLGFVFIITLLLTLWQLSVVKAELRSRSKIQADIEVDTKTNSSDSNSSYPNAQAPNTRSHVEEEKIDAEDTQKRAPVKTRTVSEYRDKILSFGVSDSKACSNAIRKLIITPDGIMKAAVLVEELGYEYAKKIFSGISDSKWTELGRYIKDHVEEFNPNKATDIMSEAYHLILGESIGSNNGTGFSQFEMLASLSESQLKTLVDSESNTNIALIASNYDSEQMVDIIKLLPDDRQQAVVLEIARFENLPKDIVNKAALELMNRLKKLHDPNKMEFKGKEYIGNFLNYLDQEQEEKILSFIEKSDPKLRDSLRKYHFSFEDVKLIPSKYLEPALEDFDSAFLAKALQKVSHELVQKISSALPEKKQLMLADDLSIQQLVSKKDMLSSRTKLLTTIKSTLAKFDFDLSSLLEGKIEDGNFGEQNKVEPDYALNSDSSDDLDKAS